MTSVATTTCSDRPSPPSAASPSAAMADARTEVPRRSWELMSITALLGVSCAACDGAYRVRFTGEADFSVVDSLTAALRAIDLRPGCDVHLDVGELDFIDLACMRELLRFAAQAERVGVQVDVVHPNPSFALLRGMLGTRVLPAL